MIRISTNAALATKSVIHLPAALKDEVDNKTIVLYKRLIVSEKNKPWIIAKN